MKERVREAVFNLVGPKAVGKHAIDLFAGTGALGLEAISRGAGRATLIEQHFPTADLISQNIKALDLESLCRVVPGNTFAWHRGRPDLGPTPWLVFCSPPYDFFVDRQAEMLSLIEGLLEAAPAESVFVVESDDRFDVGLLPHAAEWDVRRYAPAVVHVFHKKPQ